MAQKLTIAYFYPSNLNLYGDNGNVEVLYQRSVMRGFEVSVKLIDSTTQMTEETLKDVNIMFMGGGPDSGQKEIFEDFLHKKGPFVKDFIENNGVALFICGSYQLAGKYYKSADGSILEGLGVFKIYTEHFGNFKPRCIGNTVCNLSETIKKDPYAYVLKDLGNHLVGFENHGGRTFLDIGTDSLGKVIRGFGNNDEDKTEGAVYKNAFGTYYHGPFLALNPHFADFLIAKSLQLDAISPLDDTIAINAHKNRL